MTFNPQGIIQDIRADCETMLAYVTGERARTTTADETERGLFKMLIEMGLKLLTLFFILRSQNAKREASNWRTAACCTIIVIRKGGMSRSSGSSVLCGHIFIGKAKTGKGRWMQN